MEVDLDLTCWNFEKELLKQLVSIMNKFIQIYSSLYSTLFLRKLNQFDGYYEADLLFVQHVYGREMWR